MADFFERYPATSETIRSTARKARGSADAAVAVRGGVESRHRRAVAETSEELQTHMMGPIATPFHASASDVARGAIWAACQLERFADAIDVYNDTSDEPRSISKLNRAYGDLDGDPLRRGARQLIAEKGRLDDKLDDAAAEVARALDREPSKSELLREWKAGNLPVAAIGAWPSLHLKLTDLPYDLKNTAITKDGLTHLTDERLAAALVDPDLNAELRAMILDERKGAVDVLARQWRLSSATEGRVDELMCRPNSNGQIVGPDGRLYRVTIPGEGPARDPDVPVMGPMNDFIPDDGPESPWRTLGSRDGEIAYGEQIDLGMRTAFVLAGTAGAGKPLGEWQSIGKDQSQYLHMTDGSAVIDDGTEPPSSVDRQPLGPVPDSMAPSDPYNGWDRANSAAFMAITVLDGLNNGQQAEYNRHYATEVTFQESDDGERRAVINLYQVQSDGEAVRVQQSYATVDPETGEIVPAPSHE